MPDNYKEKGEGTYFNDGREVALLRYIFTHPNLDSFRNNPTALLAAIDSFGASHSFLMNVGAEKGGNVTSLIASEKPTTIVEFGAYVGYSALYFGSVLQKLGGGVKRSYVSIELEPLFGAITAAFVALAGLDDVVKVEIGPSEATIRRLVKERKYFSGDKPQVDIVFFDHLKECYIRDLKVCEALGVVDVGTVLAADNVINPGNPPYLEYVRGSVEDKKRFLKEGKKDPIVEEGAPPCDGVPTLIYESKLHRSPGPMGEDDGIEITRCTGKEK